VSTPDETGGKNVGDGYAVAGEPVAPTAVGAPGFPTTTPPSAPGQPYPQQEPDTAPERPRRGIGYTTYAITIVVAILSLLLVLFVVKNTQRIDVWLFFSTPNMSVAGALAVAAAAGLLAGLLIGIIPQVKLRRELRSLRRASRS
jgi:uncharacterized integral membrane protein